MLSGEDIKNRQLVQNDRPESYRAASYDLTVGKIIPPLDRSAGTQATGRTIGSVETFVIPPQGMVEVISRERVKLPNTVAGYATVKTGLCDRGILALNIGIIDPEYEGLISSTLINFGKSAFHLKTGEVFLRLTFFDYAPPKSLKTQPLKSDDQYVKDKESKVLQHLSRTFLNIDETVKELTAPILGEWKSGMLKYVVLGSLLVAAFAFLVTLGTSYASRWLPNQLSTVEMTALVRQLQDSTNRRIDSLQRELVLLKGTTGEASSPAQTRTAPTPRTVRRDSLP